MKMNQLVKATALAIALAVAAPSVLGMGAAQELAIKKAVTSVAPMEMPAKAAELVRKADKKDREAVAVTVVRAAIYKNRSAAAAVVAAVAKEAPEFAPAITLAATQMEREQASAIVNAALAAVPTAKVEINASARIGVIGDSAAVVPSANFSTTRGNGAGPSGYPIGTSNTPINTTTGGVGDGTYNGAGTVSAGPSVPVDYTLPRL